MDRFMTLNNYLTDYVDSPKWIGRELICILLTPFPETCCKDCTRVVRMHVSA
jgi:hypothetical protein